MLRRDADAAPLLSRAECEDAAGTCDQGGHTDRAACEAAATCGGADTLLTRTACEDSIGTCDVGAETTRAACEADNGGAGVYTPQPGAYAPAVYTPAAAYTPSLQATCQGAPAGSCTPPGPTTRAACEASNGGAGE